MQQAARGWLGPPERIRCWRLFWVKTSLFRREAKIHSTSFSDLFGWVRSPIRDEAQSGRKSDCGGTRKKTFLVIWGGFPRVWRTGRPEVGSSTSLEANESSQHRGQLTDFKRRQEEALLDKPSGSPICGGSLCLGHNTQFPDLEEMVRGGLSQIPVCSKLANSPRGSGNFLRTRGFGVPAFFIFRENAVSPRPRVGDVPLTKGDMAASNRPPPVPAFMCPLYVARRPGPVVRRPKSKFPNGIKVQELGHLWGDKATLRDDTTNLGPPPSRMIAANDTAY